MMNVCGLSGGENTVHKRAKKACKQFALLVIFIARKTRYISKPNQYDKATYFKAHSTCLCVGHTDCASLLPKQKEK